MIIFMGHSNTEHLAITLQNLGAISVLQEIFRATEAEWFVDFEICDARSEAALSYLFDSGLIEARPIANSDFNFVPSELAREIFTLDYSDCGGREPRNAWEATLAW